MCFARRCPPVPRYRYKILYAGTDHALAATLRVGLKELECFVDYCPAGWLARMLLASDIYYALLILDVVPDEAGPALRQFACSLAHRARMPGVSVPPREQADGGASGRDC